MAHGDVRHASVAPQDADLSAGGQRGAAAGRRRQPHSRGTNDPPAVRRQRPPLRVAAGIDGSRPPGDQKREKWRCRIEADAILGRRRRGPHLARDSSSGARPATLDQAHARRDNARCPAALALHAHLLTDAESRQPVGSRHIEHGVRVDAQRPLPVSAEQCDSALPPGELSNDAVFGRTALATPATAKVRQMVTAIQPPMQRMGGQRQEEPLGRIHRGELSVRTSACHGDARRHPTYYLNPDR